MSDPLDDVFPVEEASVEPVQEITEVQSEREALHDVQGNDIRDESIEDPKILVKEAAQPIETPAQEAEARQVPLNVVLDERDRRKAAEAERDRYKQQWEATQQRKPEALPDPYDDPQGFAAQMEQRYQQGLVQQKFQMSELMAKQVHGEETVQKASEWALERAQTDPVFAQAYHQQAHPIDWIVQQHKRDSLFSQLPTDVSSLDEYIEREIAKRTASVAATAPAMAVPQQANTPVKVPRSLATQGSGPSDVRQVATGPTAAVDALFS